LINLVTKSAFCSR